MAVHDARGDRVAGETGSVVDTELFHHVLAVLLHRLDTDAQFVRGLLVGTALCNELEHFHLTGGQPGNVPVDPISVSISISGRGRLMKPAFDIRAEAALAAADASNGFGELGSGGVLQEKTGGTGFNDPLDAGVIRMSGEHDHTGSWTGLKNPLRGLHPVQVRHGDVHEDHVRLEFVRHLDRFATIGGFTNHRDVHFQIQKNLHPFPDYRVIVYE